jgi:hypothetical protein
VNSQKPEEELLQLIDRQLGEGASIEIDGIGSFQHDENHQVVFKPAGEPLVFLSYAQEDRATVKKLYYELQKAGVNPWMDCQTLLPGQNWPRAIERTIEVCDFFVACFSWKSVSKRGYFQGELAYAFDVAKRVPQDDVFFIPVRLNKCELPRHILSTTHYVDLFPDWHRGVKKVLASIRRKR